MIAKCITNITEFIEYFAWWSFDSACMTVLECFLHALFRILKCLKRLLENFQIYFFSNEPLMTKPTKWHVCPVKTQISLGICPVWSESSLCTLCIAKDPTFLLADSEVSDQTGRMPRLIWVFAECTCHFVGFVVLRLKCSWVWSYRKNLKSFGTWKIAVIILNLSSVVYHRRTDKEGIWW